MKEKFKKYIQLRMDAGEEGLWFSPKRNKNLQLDELKKQMEECRACRLGRYRLNPCFGNGTYNTEIMFIGEGPGFVEDHRGEVFVGRAGKLLDSIIRDNLGLERKDVFITNIVKCHPMKDPSNPEKRGNDRPPTEEETGVCIKKFLEKQMDLIRPSVVVTLGSPSTRTILKRKTGITKLRGNIFEKRFSNTKVKIVPTYHPAYLLRSPSKKAETEKDFKLIKKLL